MSLILKAGLEGEEGSLGRGLDRKSANSAAMVWNDLGLGEETGECPFDLGLGVAGSEEGLNVGEREAGNCAGKVLRLCEERVLMLMMRQFISCWVVRCDCLLQGAGSGQWRVPSVNVFEQEILVGSRQEGFLK